MIGKTTTAVATAVFTVVMSIAPNVIVAAANASAQPAPSLVALGDSITFGYNLVPGNSHPSPEAFPYVMGRTLDDSVTDLGVPGWTSSDLLNALQKPKNQAIVRKATVITIDIGSNDILQPAIRDGLLSSVGARPVMTSVEQLQFAEQLLRFGGNLADILSIVRRLAPAAKVIIYNIYDPIPTTAKGLYAISERLITAQNELIATAAAVDHLPVADAYDAFAKHSAHYVRMGDVHPTVLGQAELAKLGIAVLDGAPAGWRLTQTEATALRQALSTLKNATAVQEQVQSVRKLNPEPRPGVKLNAKLLGVLSSLDGTVRTQTTVLRQTVDGTVSALIAVRQSPNAFSTTSETVREYVYGAHLYIDQGTIWQLVPGPRSVEQAIPSQSAGASFDLTALEQVTAIPIRGGYEYTATFNPKALYFISRELTKGLLTGNSSVPLRGTKVSIHLTLLKQNGQYRVVREKIDMAVHLPPSAFGWQARETVASTSRLGDLVYDVLLQVTTRVGLTYNDLPVPRPAGLLGAPAMK